MQIEAIRAHPGSAHVTGLWHSQKSFLLHERNNNSSPAPAPALPRPGTRGGLVRGVPETGQAPPSPPPGPFKALGEGFSQGRGSPSSMETPTPLAASPHRLLRWERRKDGGGEHRWEQLKSLFLPQVGESAPSRAPLRFRARARVDVLC